MAAAGHSPWNQYKLVDSVYSAAQRGDIGALEQHKKVINKIRSPNGNTVLHIYITARSSGKEIFRRTNNFSFIRWVLELCPDILWQANKEGETLLHIAARYGHHDIAKFILDECNKQVHEEQGITQPTRLMLEMVNDAKDTALHESVRYNYLHVVSLLIKEDPCLVYKTNSADETPLYLAAERGFLEVLEEILRRCASPADGGPCGRSALHVAVIRQDKEMVRLLLAEESICSTKQDRQGWTPLHFAAKFGNNEILKMLLTKDTDAAYMSDDEGKTALHVAAAAGKINTMQQLISTCPGCSELVDTKGWNVLHFSLTSNSDKAVKFAFQNPTLGNLINKKNLNGNTPFLQAAHMGSSITYFIFEDVHLVDKLVFNHDNLNAADIMAKSNSFTWYPELYSWRLKKNKIMSGIRPRITEHDNGRNEDGKKTRVAVHANRLRDNNLLASTLIATVSFAAGITVPGGLINDLGPHQGTAILSGKVAFRAFVILNTMSLFLSSFAVFFHLFQLVFLPNQTMKHFLGMVVGYYLSSCAMMAMMGAFISGIWAILQHQDRILVIEAIGSVVLIFSILLICGYHGHSTLKVQLKVLELLPKQGIMSFRTGLLSSLRFRHNQA